MWWLFSNKKRDTSSSHDIHLFSRIKTMEENLKNSFFNIKKDIHKVNNIVFSHDDKINHLKERVHYLENIIKNLRVLDSVEESPKEKSKKENIEQTINTDISINNPTIKWGDLTNIQQNLFMRLGLLQIEANQRRIAMKHLAEELYPEKTYNDVRSMISDYVNLLNEHGLVKKTRKGRQIFVSTTEKGLIFYDKAKKKKLLDILRKH
ncbi:hypothetical protein J4449_00430 [Candidatus Woesearchaeota archaeon]|nr:hypothetical protein [Candidatus Woesearchaeota archaeon]